MKATDNGSQNSTGGTQDLARATTEATSTQLDGYKPSAAQKVADILVDNEAYSFGDFRISKCVKDLTGLIDTLAKEVIGADENERGEFDNPHDQATEDDRNSLRGEQRERLSQLLNRGGEVASKEHDGNSK